MIDVALATYANLPDLDADDALLLPALDELFLAQKILRLLPALPLYARVDLIHDEVGTLRLMELELVEPGLWLSFAPHSVQLFADAIARRVNKHIKSSRH